MYWPGDNAQGNIYKAAMHSRALFLQDNKEPFIVPFLKNFFSFPPTLSHNERPPNNAFVYNAPLFPTFTPIGNHLQEWLNKLKGQ